MAREVRRKGFGRGAIPVASVLILACILASSWITYDRTDKVLDAKQWVAHTWEVKANVERIYGVVVTAESDVRAFVLSKNEPSYERYLRSEAEADSGIRHVRELTSDNQNQKLNLDALQTAIDERYGLMRRSVEARKSRTVDETIAFLTQGGSKGKGIQSMDDVRRRIGVVTAEEDRLLQIRKGRSVGESVQAELSFLFAIATSVVLISAFGLLSNRLVLTREAAADEERALSIDLAREVERTKAAEARLKSTMVELRRSNEELQNFAFVASHDLQEPLRKIRAFSDRVRRRTGSSLDEESRDSLQRVDAAADRMQRLILDLLELSRITTKTRPHVPVNLALTIAEVADDLHARLEETGGRIEHGPLPAVFADPAQIRQLMQNLLANALKFRKEGVPPVVSIGGTTRPDGRIAIEVRDNGIGFEEKYADRIFVVFQRLHGRGEYEGSGIGLSIARKIVERHGGTIEAGGRLGDGATFLFDLPGETPEPLLDATLEAVKEGGKAE